MLDLAHFAPPSQGGLNLQAYDPGYTFNADVTISRRDTETYNREIIQWQERLNAEGKQGLLVIYQAMDTAGKDNSIRALFSGVNPQGLEIHSFTSAGKKEARFDELLRYHSAAPSKGMIGIFNRSHYEPLIKHYAAGHDDVSSLIAKTQHLNNFEALLNDSGVRVIKFYLHISRTEYRRRLTQRLKNPDEHWKLHKSDLKTHANWHQTIAAYQKVISLTHSTRSPWYIIPSNKQWFRDYLIGQIICKTLQQMNPLPVEVEPPYTLQDLEDLSLAIDRDTR